MFKILYIQTIWVPSKELYEKNLNSLISLIEYFTKYPNPNIEFVFCGWTYKQEYFSEICKYISSNLTNKYTIFGYDHNYGKAYCVNTSLKSIDLTHEYIVISDSDMLLDINCDNMFDKLINLSLESVNILSKPFGYIAPMQKIYNCHLSYIYDNSINTSYGRLLYPSIDGGIAGGYLFISGEAWRSINGYRNGGVCFGEDAYIMIDMISNGYSCYVSEDIYINHPNEHSDMYHKYKVDQCQNPQIEFKDSIQNTERFFKSENLSSLL